MGFQKRSVRLFPTKTFPEQDLKDYGMNELFDHCLFYFSCCGMAGELVVLELVQILAQRYGIFEQFVRCFERFVSRGRGRIDEKDGGVTCSSVKVM